MVIPADSLCISGFFPVCCGFFPFVYSWEFVHQSSIFRVVDVVCAVSYAAAKCEWIYFSVMDFFLCVVVYTVQ